MCPCFTTQLVECPGSLEAMSTKSKVVRHFLVGNPAASLNDKSRNKVRNVGHARPAGDTSYSNAPISQNLAAQGVRFVETRHLKLF